MLKFRVLIQDNLTSFRAILLGFIFLIYIGAVLLTLPAASADGQSVPFINALFTSASAACVTGLIAYDTAIQWTVFGRTVILILIQIGGLGVITVAVAAMTLTNRKIGILQRVTMQDAISAHQIGGIIRFTKFFVFGTIIMEGIGTLCLLPVFLQEYAFFPALGYSLFHSVSAFCNAGFDLMGMHGPFSSLTSYASNAWVNVVIMTLIITGGIGFLTWDDLLKNRFRFKKLRLQTKIILTVTSILLILPFLYFFLIEFSAYPMKERILYSMFQSVTPRTAGFNTYDYGQMSENGMLITIFLMIIGGAPGSTAGGMKVTTIAVMMLTANSYLHKRENVNCFNRRIDIDVIHNALTLMTVYILMLLLGTVIISGVENIPVLTAMFECASALGTVGLTAGITPYLSPVSKYILIFFMFFGRVGGTTLAYALLSPRRKAAARLPVEKVTVG